MQRGIIRRGPRYSCIALVRVPGRQLEGQEWYGVWDMVASMKVVVVLWCSYAGGGSA